jgi:hypothetical protein
VDGFNNQAFPPCAIKQISVAKSEWMVAANLNVQTLTVTEIAAQEQVFAKLGEALAFGHRRQFGVIATSIQHSI